jgi:hypothetical protein
MIKSEFEQLEFRVSTYKALDKRQKTFLLLKEYLSDPDIEFMYVSVSGKSFRGEEFDVSCFRKELMDLCDVQIYELEREKIHL